MDGLPSPSGLLKVCFHGHQIDDATETLSAPMGNWRATTFAAETCSRDSMERSKLESSRSIQVRTKVRGMSYSVQ